MRRVIEWGFVFWTAVLSCSALAQTYPSQPIKFVVPFTPGTGIDIIVQDLGEVSRAKRGP